MTVPTVVVQKIDWFATARSAARAVRYAGRLGRNINDAHRAARRVAGFATASRRALSRVGGQLHTGIRAGRSGIREAGSIGSRVGQQIGRATRVPSSIARYGAGIHAGLRGGENAFNRARDVGMTGSYLRGIRAGVTVRNVPGLAARNFGKRSRIHRYIRNERSLLMSELQGGKVSLTAARNRATGLYSCGMKSFLRLSSGA